MLFLGLEPIFI